MPRPPLRARARQQPSAKPNASRGPPRRRPRPSPPPPPPPPPAAPSTAADNDRDATAEAFIVSDADGDAADTPELPLFNTTFHTYRASPLHVGPQPLTADRLARVAASLRDALVGDVVRGVQVRLPGASNPDGGSGARYGALTLATLAWARLAIAAEDDDDNEDRQDDSENESQRRRGLLLTLRYEAGRCEALFLPPVASSSSSSPQPAGFLRPSLVLVRMPPALRIAVLGFLAREFDCRFSPLALPGPVLLAAWEGWVRDVGLGVDDNDEAPAASSPALRKDVVLTLAFRLPSSTTGGSTDAEKQQEQHSTPGLRTLELTLRAIDVDRFVASGKDILSESESSPSTQAGLSPGPFTAGLARYLQHHLALDVHHGAVQVVRISCGGFVLSESRLKLFRPSAGDSDDDGGRGRSKEAEAVHNLLLRLCTRHSAVDVT